MIKLEGQNYKLTLGYVSTGISKRKILLTVYELGLAGAPCQSIVIPGVPLNLCYVIMSLSAKIIMNFLSLLVGESNKSKNNNLRWRTRC